MGGGSDETLNPPPRGGGSLEQIKQTLVNAAADAGLIISSDLVGRIAPTIDPTLPISHLALQLGRMAAHHGLYRRGEHFVTIADRTGEVRPMMPARFVAWVEEFCAIARAKQASLTRETATLVLASDAFRNSIPEVDAIYQVSLPVQRRGGAIEWLPPGYDHQSRIFTAAAIAYETDWTVEQALTFLRVENQSFPFADRSASEPLERNRSYAVLLLAGLGTYCRAMFPAGTARPLIAVVSNQQGVGKSTLVAQALSPVFGEVATSKTPKDDDRMSAELEAVAQTRRPFLFFDDSGSAMKSAPLARFLTSSSHTGRRYFTNDTVFEVPNVTQVFATAVALEFSTDIFRRALVVELFLAGDARARKFDRVITPATLAAPRCRANYLAAFCALVKAWDRAGQPLCAEAMPSFESWTEKIAGMLDVAGVANPLSAPKLLLGGDVDRDQMVQLLTEIAGRAEEGQWFTRAELLSVAKELGILDELTCVTPSEAMAAARSFGRRLQLMNQRVMRDERGRTFRFGKGKSREGAKYLLTFLAPADSAAIG